MFRKLSLIVFIFLQDWFNSIMSASKWRNILMKMYDYISNFSGNNHFTNYKISCCRALDYDAVCCDWFKRPSRLDTWMTTFHLVSKSSLFQYRGPACKVTDTMACFTQQLCRSFSTSAVRNVVIKNVTIIGGGQMGAGIAQVSKRSESNSSN